MVNQVRATDEKRSLLKTVLGAIFAGFILGVIDLWAFEPSIRLFFAGVAAGITFALTFFISIHLFGSLKVTYLLTLTAASGGLGGLAWWSVSQSSIRPVIAVIIGILLALIAVWADRGFKSDTY